MISVSGVNIKIKLTKQDYTRIKKKQPIKKTEAIEWVHRCVVGKITKKDLDKERLDETNSMDMF